MTTSTPNASVRIPEKVGTKSSAKAATWLSADPVVALELLVVAIVHLDRVLTARRR